MWSNFRGPAFWEPHLERPSSGQGWETYVSVFSSWLLQLSQLTCLLTTISSAWNTFSATMWLLLIPQLSANHPLPGEAFPGYKPKEGSPRPHFLSLSTLLFSFIRAIKNCSYAFYWPTYSIFATRLWTLWRAETISALYSQQVSGTW